MSWSNALLVCAGAAGALAASSPATAQGLTALEQIKLFAPDGSSGDDFGRTVAIDGERLVVGTRRHAAAMDVGVAYVFVRDGADWVLETMLASDDGDSDDGFGWSVAISGDRIAIGARADTAPSGERSGSAYVFMRGPSGWTQEAKLLPPDPQDNDGFGHAIALDGDTVVVGAPFEDGPFLSNTNSGSVYTYERAGTIWAVQQKLVPLDTDSSDVFGESVGLDGDRFVVGARNKTIQFDFDGAAYVFHRMGGVWSEEDRVVSDQPEPVGQFGRSVDIDGDVVVVGADWELGLAGTARVFRRSGTSWIQEQTLLPSDPGGNDRFGWAVAVQGSTVVVGAYYDREERGFMGSAYLFERGLVSWNESQRILASDRSTGHWFGHDVDIDKDRVVIGAVNGRGAKKWSGVAYVERLVDETLGTGFCFGDGSGAPCPCGNETPVGAREGCANSTGAGGAILAGESLSVGQDDFTLATTGLPAGRPAVLFMGTSTIGVPYGDGQLCVGGSTLRMGVQKATGLGYTFWGPDLAAAGGWSAGETRFFQVAYRDPLGPCGFAFNATNGLEVTFGP